MTATAGSEVLYVIMKNDTKQAVLELATGVIIRVFLFMKFLIN